MALTPSSGSRINKANKLNEETQKLVSPNEKQQFLRAGQPSGLEVFPCIVRGEVATGSEKWFGMLECLDGANREP
jgi:hypothetical protein